MRGGFTEARGVFPKPVCVCAQVRAFPAPERFLLLRSCFGLTREASAQGRAAPNSALFVLQEGAFVALLSQQQRAKELSVVFTPVPVTGDSPNRCHLIQIRAELQVKPHCWCVFGGAQS